MTWRRGWDIAVPAPVSFGSRVPAAFAGAWISDFVTLRRFAAQAFVGDDTEHRQQERPGEGNDGAVSALTEDLLQRAPARLGQSHGCAQDLLDRNEHIGYYGVGRQRALLEGRYHGGVAYLRCGSGREVVGQFDLERHHHLGAAAIDSSEVPGEGVAERVIAAA